MSIRIIENGGGRWSISIVLTEKMKGSNGDKVDADRER